MSKSLMILITLLLFLTLTFKPNSQIVELNYARLTQANDYVQLKSPNGRFLVRFSQARSDGDNVGKLWGKITIQDLTKGEERWVLSAEGSRGDDPFQAFSIYDDTEAWSPDGLYLAYWDDACINESAVEGGVVCHSHSIRFLAMDATQVCAKELILDRYGFGGWVKGRAHTLWEVVTKDDGSNGSVKRNPCVKVSKSRKKK